MFGRLISYATSGLTNLIGKYAIRASVAVPFLFAFAFLAGLTVILIDAFGYRDAYLMLAAALAAMGLLAVVAERHDDQESSLSDTSPIATAAIEAGKQMPQAIVGVASEAAISFRAIADIAARNSPLVLAASITMLLIGGAQVGKTHAFRHRSRF